MPGAAWLEIPDFAVRIAAVCSIRNFQVSVFGNIPYPPSLPYDSPLLGHAASYATVSSNCELYSFA